MSAQAEIDAVQDFLLLNSENLDVAMAVNAAWPKIVDEVCHRFLKRLCNQIRQSKRLPSHWSDTQTGFSYGGNKPLANWIWIYRKAWKPYGKDSEAKSPATGNRIAIVLAADAKGPNSWFVAVRTPLLLKDMSESQASRRFDLQQVLESELGSGDGQNTTWYPWWRYLRGYVKHWESLIPDLHRECESVEMGRITRCVVDDFLDVATQAIPVVDKIESR